MNYEIIAVGDAEVWRLDWTDFRAYTIDGRTAVLEIGQGMFLLLAQKIEVIATLK